MEKLGQEYRRRASPVQCHIPIPFRDRGMNLLNTTFLTSATSAVVRHSRLPRAGVGHSRLSAPSPPPPQVFAVPGLRFPPANAPRLRQSSPSPALVLPLAATGHSRACFRSAPPRSWRGCPPVSHAAASTPP